MTQQKTYTSFPISNNLFLIKAPNTLGAKPAAPAATNHILVIDCSGSMYGAIDKIAQQIKNKLPSLIGETDTLSMVYFSSRGDFGTIIEGAPIRSMKDLSEVHTKIDRNLRVRGATGFKEPFEEAGRIAERLALANPNSVNNLIFMTDGCENEWPRNTVIDVVAGISERFASTTMVEYGYYADRRFLTQLAESCGGSLIFAKDFNSYIPQLEKAMSRQLTKIRRVDVSAPDETHLAFSMTPEGELLTFQVEDESAAVPEGAIVWFLSATEKVEHGKVARDVTVRELLESGDHKTSVEVEAVVAATYASLSLLSVRAKPEMVYDTLKAIGDVRFINQFSKCFGKQQYSEFMEAAKKAAFSSALRFVDGMDFNKVPKDDAFTILDFLSVLTGTPDNRVMLDHSAFSYNRIGRGTVDASQILTEEEQAQVDALTDELAKTKKNAAKVKEINSRIAAICDKPAPLKFEVLQAEKEEGYSVGDLVFEETRPNVSFRVFKRGTVDLSSRLPDQFKGTKVGSVPPVFPTHIYRNYTVLKDGLLNIDVLPCKFTASSLETLKAEGVDISQDPNDPEISLVNLTSLPPINRNMVKKVTAKAFFAGQMELLLAKAEQKVLNSISKELEPEKVSVAFEALYGKDAALWLKEQGITDSGFSPKSVQAESKDFYMSKELVIKVGGFSTLPSLNDVRKKLASAAAKPAKKAKTATEEDKVAVNPTYVMGCFLAEVEAQKAKLSAEEFAKWVENHKKETTKKVRKLLLNTAQTKFSILVGQAWFEEFSTIDENQLTIDCVAPDAAKTKFPVSISAVLTESKIYI